MVEHCVYMVKATLYASLLATTQNDVLYIYINTFLPHNNDKQCRGTLAGYKHDYPFFFLEWKEGKQSCKACQYCHDYIQKGRGYSP